MNPVPWLIRVAAALLLSSGVAAASANANPASPVNPADGAYSPTRGQQGKDVIWIPTPAGLVEKMLEAARVTPRDRVVDLGAGDGIIAITAAGKFGAQAVGIEYNPKLAEYARRKAAEAGVADRVRILTGDLFKEDFSFATVVTLYLYPDLNMRLRPTLLAMKPGTRVVSHAFTMGDWEPDETMSYQSARAYLWVVPARIDGDWTLNGLEGGPVRLRFRQSFQQIGGMLTRDGESVPLVGARLRGDEVSFKIVAQGRQEIDFSGRVVGQEIRGTVTVDGAGTPVRALRQ